jgi:hypothetical protein
MPNEPGIRVTLSAEGLRRAANDNDLLTESSKRHERIARKAFDIACAAALGLVLAWGAVNFGGMVS